MSAPKKTKRTFWPYSPCPETHHEVSRTDKLITAVKARWDLLSIDEIVIDLEANGWDHGEIYNAIKAVEIMGSYPNG